MVRLDERLIMARTAIREFGVKHWIVFSLLPMAIETPAHIHDLGVLIYGHLAHIAVAILAVQSCSDMGAMDKMDKVRHLRNRNPYDRLIFRNGFH